MYTRMKFLITATLLVVGVAPVFGQQGEFRSLIRFEVKPGMFTEFQAAVKADKEAMAKAGYKRSQTWWRALSGSNEVLMVRYYKTYADMDVREKPDAAVSLARARVMKCVSAQETVIDQIIPEASTIVDRSKLPPYIRALRSTVRPDRMLDYTKWLKEEIGPLLKKEGMPLFLSSQVRYGKTANMVTTVTGMNSLASFDEPLPLSKVMSAEAYAALTARRAAMITHSENTIYRSLPELNYVP